MENKEFSSFRDPAGYVYYEGDKIYRKINRCYFDQYNYFMCSGLYDELVENGYLIRHREIEKNHDYIIIEAERIPFISYPYEWCFEELKDAAMLTLNIQKIALKYDMTLKDASGYNVQFLRGKVIFIDTLSFDFYKEGSPWGAYGQFCRHFMAPLILMRYVDENLNCLLKNYIDGIPIDFANHILNGRGGFTAKQHIKWHSKAISKNNDKVRDGKALKVSKNSIENMIDMMIRQVGKLKRKKLISEWDTYYDNTNYGKISDESKIKLIRKCLKIINFSDNDILWDLAGNDGKYSRIASSFVENVVSFDVDLNVVNRSYSVVKENEETRILPLLFDVTNPSPAIGFGCSERQSLMGRGPVKCVMALAFIHHISISNNVGFDKVAAWFSKLGEYLIIEFVPKEDSQVQKLLKTREDIFDRYTQDDFEECFLKYYEIMSRNCIRESKRVIYLMRSINKNER